MTRTTKKQGVAKALERRLSEAADALRGNQEPSEYKHVVLGLVFLNDISDRFAARTTRLVGHVPNCAGAILTLRVTDTSAYRDHGRGRSTPGIDLRSPGWLSPIRHGTGPSATNRARTTGS